MKNYTIQIKCARKAAKLIKQYILQQISFNQETTLSGKSIIKNIKFAKEKGSYIIMNYIGVEDPGVAKERVKIRVSKGGHGIPDKDIERRYYDSLSNLNNVIEICDEVNIYDNTEVLREIIYLKNDKIIWKDKKIPNWANNILEK